MAQPDSTITKRKPPVKRGGQSSLLDPLPGIAEDVLAGIRELKRQTGAAVENVKSSYQRIKQAIKP